MKFKGIKTTGYQKLASYYTWLKDADRAALPTDYQGMLSAGEAYAVQMEQMGLPRSDLFWDQYADFSFVAQTDDIKYMQDTLGRMSNSVKKIMESPERYLDRPLTEIETAPRTQPDLMTSVKPWSTTGLDWDKLQEGINQSVARWEQTVRTQAEDPYSYFWDDVAEANTAIQWQDYDKALELYNKITDFESNYPDAQKIPESEAEGLNFDFLKGGRKVAIPVQRRSPKRRQDRTLSLLEEILGKPVKNLYDEEGDISDMGEAWDTQDLDFTKGPSKGIDEEKVFEVEVEDEPEVEDEFVPEVKKEVDPFEM